MSAGGFRYWAFLSYSHADEAQARRLHTLLERYALPRTVRKAHALPRRLFPIFRDVEELEASSSLNQRLRDALDQSRWLVVLCSPSSARSAYVNQEIEYFIARHGRGRILCVLLDGEPAESFPPAIRALPEEPLAADCRPGRDDTLARLRLIAALAGVGFTELRNREAERRRRMRTLALAGATAAIACGIAAWDLLWREQVDYYVNYVRQHGIWQGVDEISAETARHRGLSFRFLRHGRLHPPERVDFVDGHGACAQFDIFDATALVDILDNPSDYSDTDPTRRYCAAVFGYDSGGAIQRESLLDYLQVPRASLIYTSPDLAQISWQGFAAASAGGGARYVQFARDANGHDRELRFLYGPGMPRANAARQYGYALEHDVAGHLLSRSFLDPDGKLTGESERFDYSPEGWRLATRRLDAGGQARYDDDGWCCRSNEYDRWGNLVRLTYLDPAGQPAMAGIDNFASGRVERDDAGNVVTRSFFDASGEPIAPYGEIYSGFSPVDEHGHIRRMEYHDRAGHLTAGGNGVAAFEYDYDSLGNLVEWRYYDVDGHLADSNWASAIVRLKRDAHGNMLEMAFFDRNGAPVESQRGAIRVATFDAQDRQTEVRFLDAHRQPMAHGVFKAARVSNQFDERGNLVEDDYYGTDGLPVINDRGFARRRKAYDELGNLVETRYFGTDGSLRRNTEGIAIERLAYDRLGRPVEWRYFDEQERPVRNSEGFFGRQEELDTAGRTLVTRYLGGDGKLEVVPKLGYAAVRSRYDPHGEPLEQRFLDAGLRELSRRGAIARVEYTRDGFGHELERRYFDGTGAPVPYPLTGCATLRSQYSHANLEHEACLDARGKLHARADTGWAEHRVTRKHARVVKEEWLDAAGRPVKPKA